MLPMNLKHASSIMFVCLQYIAHCTTLTIHIYEMSNLKYIFLVFDITQTQY